MCRFELQRFNLIGFCRLKTKAPKNKTKLNLKRRTQESGCPREHRLRHTKKKYIPQNHLHKEIGLH